MVDRHLLGDYFQAEKITKSVEDVKRYLLSPLNTRFHPTIHITIYKEKVFQFVASD